MTADPHVFRFTVRMPMARYEKLRAIARERKIDPGQIVQAMVDRVDLSTLEHDFGKIVDLADRTFGKGAPSREMAARALANGLTVQELAVFRAVRHFAGMELIARPMADEVAAMSGVPIRNIDAIIARLVTKGFLAVAPSTGRGRRIAYRIARMPDL